MILLRILAAMAVAVLVLGLAISFLALVVWSKGLALILAFFGFVTFVVYQILFGDH